MSVEERIRRASENILENASLGGDLMDDEAQILLEWGLNLAERFARATGAMDEGQAALIIDESLAALRRTMRRVGRLVGNLTHVDSGKAQERMQKLLEAADQLPGVQVQQPADLQVELEALRELPPGQALQRVLTWFSLGEEE